MALSSSVHVNNLLRIDRVIFVWIDNNAEKTRICVDKTSMVSKYVISRVKIREMICRQADTGLGTLIGTV